MSINFKEKGCYPRHVLPIKHTCPICQKEYYECGNCGFIFPKTCKDDLKHTGE